MPRTVDVDYRRTTPPCCATSSSPRATCASQADEARATGGLDFENGEWTIAGDVRIRAEGGNLQSDKAVVTFRNNRHLAGHDHRARRREFEQQRTDGTHWRAAAPTPSTTKPAAAP